MQSDFDFVKAHKKKQESLIMALTPPGRERILSASPFHKGPTMAFSYTITIDDVEIDATVNATASGGSPGKYDGPYEDSYPAEPPEVEIDDVVGPDGKEIDFATLSESDQDGIIEKAMTSYDDSRDYDLYED